MSFCWFDHLSNQRLLRESTQSVNTTSGYRGMWHVFQKSILLTGLFSKEILHGKGGHTGAHKVRSLRKSMNPVSLYLEWKGGLRLDFPGETLGKCYAGLMRRCAPWRMPPMID